MKKVSYILSLVMLVTVIFSNKSVVAQQRSGGWSPQAKGTVIGAGVGATAGAIIHKRNRVVGGVVGGVAGGAAGYAIGKHIDNKQKAKEAEAVRIAAAQRSESYETPTYKTSSSRKFAGKSATAPKRTAKKNVVKEAEETPVMLASVSPAPYIVNSAYLPNNFYGDFSKPYATSEYRRKSW